MLKIGDYNTLKIIKSTEQGYYLESFLGEILLPGKYITPDMAVGDEITVFIYRDSEDRLIATTEKPLAKVGDFAYLQVKDINRTGFFLDWGLSKDLLLPYREKRGQMKKGESYVVKVLLDPITERIIASARLEHYFANDELDLAEGDEVEALIYHISNLGYQAVVNQRYHGLIYRNQVFTALKVGDTVQGIVKKIREGNKLDIMLPRHFKEERLNAQEEILQLLEKNNGFLPWNDKTDPEAIKRELQISKKTFKKAIGGLYKQRKIIIKENGIYFPENAE